MCWLARAKARASNRALHPRRSLTLPLLVPEPLRKCALFTGAPRLALGLPWSLDVQYGMKTRLPDVAQLGGYAQCTMPDNSSQLSDVWACLTTPPS